MKMEYAENQVLGFKVPKASDLKLGEMWFIVSIATSLVESMCGEVDCGVLKEYAQKINL